jgi:hypothetical protein
MKAVDIIAKEADNKTKKEESMKLTLKKDKVTKNKVVRYADGDNHNIYLQPEEVEKLGNPEVIAVTIEAGK